MVLSTKVSGSFVTGIYGVLSTGLDTRTTFIVAIKLLLSTIMSMDYVAIIMLLHNLKNS